MGRTGGARIVQQLQRASSVGGGDDAPPGGERLERDQAVVLAIGGETQHVGPAVGLSEAPVVESAEQFDSLVVGRQLGQTISIGTSADDAQTGRARHGLHAGDRQVVALGPFQPADAEHAQRRPRCALGGSEAGEDGRPVGVERGMDHQRADSGWEPGGPGGHLGADGGVRTHPRGGEEVVVEPLHQRSRRRRGDRQVGVVGSEPLGGPGETVGDLEDHAGCGGAGGQAPGEFERSGQVRVDSPAGPGRQVRRIAVVQPAQRVQHPQPVVGVIDRPRRVLAGDHLVKVCEIPFGEGGVTGDELGERAFPYRCLEQLGGGSLASEFYR